MRRERIPSRCSHIPHAPTMGYLCVTLNMTPLQLLLHLDCLVRFRRMFGLFAFFYGCPYLAIYVWLDK